MLRISMFIAALFLLSACNRPDYSQYLVLAEAYDVTIHRDIWGVPHIYGATDADTAFGFAYAQAEDNWPTIEDGIPFYRGTQASHSGIDAAVTDYLVKLLGIHASISTDAERVLSRRTLSYVQAFADGLNYYAARNPETVSKNVLPITSSDIIAANMLRHLLFYGFEAEVEKLTRAPADAAISSSVSAASGQGTFIDGLPIGSNAFAISPAYSTDGATRLAINSHQPTTGPVAWYEAHLRSDEGLNVMGGIFPGSPSISVGFNETVAWAATVNKPDLFDAYELEINPQNSNQYRLDDRWLDLQVDEVEIEVLLWGLLPWTVTREVLHSKHGPVLRTDHGTFAFRYAGMGELRQVEQWYRMNRAQSLDEWREAMRMQSFASFNFVAADSGGNILFVHNSLTPIREENHDWSRMLPGNDASLIWQEYLPFDDLPQVINPASGYLMSANQSPFRVTDDADNPDPENYSVTAGFQSRMTNRAYRGLELFEELGPISEAEFFAIKHDKAYSKQSRSFHYLAEVASIDYLNDPRLQQAQQILADWNLDTDLDSRGAALGVCLLSNEWTAEQRGSQPPPVRTEFENCVGLLDAKFGRPDPIWSEVNRHVRGTLNLPVGGGPDTLRAIYGRGLEDDGYLTNVAGDGLYYLVSWDQQGHQSVRGIHQFGAATLDPTSPHYSDQALLYAREDLKDPLFDHETLMQNLERSYQP